MSKSYLDPKTLDETAVVRWKNDIITLFKRMGAYGILSSLAIFTVASVAVGSVASLGDGIILIIPLGLAVGVVWWCYLYNALTRARNGLGAAPADDLIRGFSDVLQNKTWAKKVWLRSLLITGIILGLIILVFAIVYAISSMASSGVTEQPEETTRKSLTLIDCARHGALYIGLFAMALRKMSYTSMTYFLNVRAGVEFALAEKLDVLARIRNEKLMNKVSMALGLIGLGIIFFGSSLGWFVIPVIFLFSFIVAAINLCAWHDIFDPDEGLAEKQEAKELQLAQIPL